jgi:hypothetical protein
MGKVPGELRRKIGESCTPGGIYEAVKGLDVVLPRSGLLELANAVDRCTPTDFFVRFVIDAEEEFDIGHGDYNVKMTKSANGIGRRSQGTASAALPGT